MKHKSCLICYIIHSKHNSEHNSDQSVQIGSATRLYNFGREQVRLGTSLAKHYIFKIKNSKNFSRSCYWVLVIADETYSDCHKAENMLD